jgi:flagellin
MSITMPTAGIRNSSYRQLNLSSKASARSAERMTSGLRINRGRDDPAGLVISEKFRLQAAGLRQAIKNTNNAISMIQTADSALGEMTTVLRNMRNIAVKASNVAVNDEKSLEALQEQVKNHIESLTIIANTTSYGKTKLFVPTREVITHTRTHTTTETVVNRQVSATDPRVTLLNVPDTVTAGTYGVTDVAQASGVAVAGAHSSISGRTVVRSEGNQVRSNPEKAGLNEKLQFTSSLWGGTIEVDIGNMLQNQVVNAINGNATLTNAGISAVWGNGSRLQISVDRITGLDDLVIRNTGGTFVQNGNDGYLAKSVVDATSSTKLGHNETLTFSNGTNTAIVNLTAGTTISTAVTNINNALTANGIAVTASWNAGLASLVLTNNQAGSSATILNTVSTNRVDSGVNSKTSLGLGAYATGAGVVYNIADGTIGNAAVTGTDAISFSGKIGGFDAFVTDGDCLNGAVGTAVEGIKVRIAAGAEGDLGSIVITMIEEVIATVHTETYTEVKDELKDLTFQTGAFSNQSVSFKSISMKAEDLGKTAEGDYTSQGLDKGVCVANIDVRTERGARDAIEIIDAAINEVALHRAKLGGFQKYTLETNLRSLSIAAHNIQRADSTIRDTAYDEEILNYSRAQILQNTSMAMLVQMNQDPYVLMYMG